MVLRFRNVLSINTEVFNRGVVEKLRRHVEFHKHIPLLIYDLPCQLLCSFQFSLQNAFCVLFFGVFLEGLCN